MATPLDLVALADALRAANTTVDLRQLLAAQEFLAAAQRAGVPLEAAEQVHVRIAPILCGNEVDRATLLEVLRRAFGKEPHEEPQVVARPPPRVRKGRARTIAIVAAALPFLAVAIVHWDRTRLRDVRIRVSKDGKDAPATTVVTVHHPPAPDEHPPFERGTSSVLLHLRRTDPPRSVEAHDGNYQGALEDVTAARPSRDLQMSLPIELPSPTDAAPPEQAGIELKPLRTLLEPGLPPKRYQPDRGGLAIGALLAGVAAFALWWSLDRLRRRLILRRMPVRGRAEFASLAADAPPPAADVALLTMTAAALRRARPQDEPQLQVDASIERALSGVHPVELVFAPRRAAPEYIALVERQGPQDHQAHLFRELLGRLVELGVQCDIFSFHSDPRVCTAYDEPSRTIPLADLLSIHHRADILVFADSRLLLDSMSGGLAEWAGWLIGSRRATVLTPEPPGRWTAAVEVLEAEGFDVVPATLAGLAAMAEADDLPASSRFLPAAYARPYPRSIDASPSRWLARTPPPAGELSRLLRELQAYLGPAGFRWLAACAVYPDIQWPLTCDLGEAAGVTRAPQQADELAALARLIWFRLGFFPEWLRKALIAALSSAEERPLRAAVEARLLRWASKGPDARGGQMRIGAWTQPAHVARAAPEGSPLRDAVFLGFISSGAAASTAVAAPAALLRYFARVGAFGEELSEGAARWTRWARRASLSLRHFFAVRPQVFRVAASVYVALLAAFVLSKATNWFAIPLPQPAKIDLLVTDADGDRAFIARDDGSAAGLESGAPVPFTPRFTSARITAVAIDANVYVAGYDNGNIWVQPHDHSGFPLVPETQPNASRPARVNSLSLVGTSLAGISLVAATEDGSVREFNLKWDFSGTSPGRASFLPWQLTTATYGTSPGREIYVATRAGWRTFQGTSERLTSGPFLDLVPKDVERVAFDVSPSSSAAIWSSSALTLYALGDSIRAIARFDAARSKIFPIVSVAVHQGNWAIAVNQAGESFILQPDGTEHKLPLPLVTRVALAAETLTASDGNWVKAWSFKTPDFKKPEAPAEGWWQSQLRLRLDAPNPFVLSVAVGDDKDGLAPASRTTVSIGGGKDLQTDTRGQIVISDVKIETGARLTVKAEGYKTYRRPLTISAEEITAGKATRVILLSKLDKARALQEQDSAAATASPGPVSVSASIPTRSSQLTVGPGESYTTISAAMNDASNGDKVAVNSGTYHEHVQLKAGVKLKANNIAATIIDGDGKGWVVRMADDSEISGFTIRGSGKDEGANDAGVLIEDCKQCFVFFNRIAGNGHYGVILRRSNAGVSSNVIEDNALSGIYVDQGGFSIVQKNIITRHAYSAINIANKNMRLIFRNNTLARAGEAGIVCNDALTDFSDLTIVSNIFADMAVGIRACDQAAESVKSNVFAVTAKAFIDRNGTSVSQLANGAPTLVLDKSNRIVADAGFVGNSYKLAPGSPAIGAGQLGADAGALQYEAPVQREPAAGPPRTTTVSLQYSRRQDAPAVKVLIGVLEKAGYKVAGAASSGQALQPEVRYFYDADASAAAALAKLLSGSMGSIEGRNLQISPARADPASSAGAKPGSIEVLLPDLPASRTGD